MACNTFKLQISRVLTQWRGQAPLACPRALGQPAEVELKMLDNKAVVATSDSQLPITRVSVAFRAGSRFETYENLGASHILRIAGGLSTENSTGFAITRNLQQKGIGLSVMADRELVTYTVEGTSDSLECGLRFLQNVIKPMFKHWEISDSIPLIKTQIAAVPPQVRAVELMHKAAFRYGLGNSIYIPKFQIGTLSTETLLHYVTNTFTASRCAIVGVGVDSNTLVGFAKGLELGSGSGRDQSSPTTYYGGDARKDTPGSLTHVAIAGEGGAFNNLKEALTFAVLQYAMGTQATKYGQINGGFSKALYSIVGDGHFSFSTLNACYLDAGLFGFVLTADAPKMGKAMEAIIGVMKAGTVSQEHVNQGIAKLKFAFTNAYSHDQLLSEEMAMQVTLTRKMYNINELLATIDSITLQDVQQAAKKAGSSKLSIGAVGNLSTVPYASEFA